MQGSVRKKGNKWYYYFDIIDLGGKRKRIERSGGKTKSEALEALTNALYKYNNGYIEPQKLKYDDYIEDWLENYIKENRKINTYVRYKEIYTNNIKPYLGQYLLKDLKPILIEKLINSEKKRGLSNTTLQTIYGVINTSLNRAVKLQLINDNICKFVERPRRNKFTANILTIDEFNIMLNNLDTTKYGDYIFSLALMVTIELGLRRGELAGLEWENIDFENNIVRIRNNLIYLNTSVELDTPKTLESQRDIYVSDEILEKLKKHKEVQDSNKTLYNESYETNMFNNRVCNFVFTWENGKYVHPNYFTLKFSRLSKESGINKKVRFHDLRHTNATILLAQGIDFKIIQTRLGHSDISTTLNIYSHVTMEMQKSASKKISTLLSPK